MLNTCRVCSKSLILGENWTEGQARGRVYICRACMSERGKSHYRQHAERAAELQRARLRKPDKAKAAAEYRSQYYAANRAKWIGYRNTERDRCATSAWHRAGKLITWVRARAAKRGWNFDLTREWAEQKLAAGKCEVTGLAFQYDARVGCQLLPWAPSIDRIDSTKGYTTDNCRMVVWIYNMAKAAWSDDDVMRMARALAK